ncbi:MAG: malate dehydrogenase, partial [Ignavibacteriaceae bacterium]
STVNGIPISELINEEKIKKLIERTRNGGIEIVNHLKSGGAFYAPSSAVLEIIDSIVKNRNRILPCSAWHEGEYGLEKVFCGVPVKLSSAGIEQIIELKLTNEELSSLKKSAGEVGENIKKIIKLLKF